PVSNTPMATSNMAFVYNVFGPSLPNSGYEGWSLQDWVFKNKFRVHAGNHNLPQSYTYNGVPVTLAPVADIRAEQVHSWNFDWGASTTYYNMIPANDPNDHVYEKDVR